jgi:hypothetical protein
VDNGTLRRVPGRVLYLVISGAPAPEGVPALITACQAAGWQVVVFSTPAGTRFVDPAEVEQLTGEPVRSEYRMPSTGAPVPPADAVLACPLTRYAPCSTSSMSCSARTPAARRTCSEPRLSQVAAALRKTSSRWLTVTVPLPGHLPSTRLVRSMRTAGVGGLAAPLGPC